MKKKSWFSFCLKKNILDVHKIVKTLSYSNIALKLAITKKLKLYNNHKLVNNMSLGTFVSEWLLDHALAWIDP